MKKALARTGSMNSWEERLERVTAGENKLGHSALYNTAPEKIKDRPGVIYELRRETQKACCIIRLGLTSEQSDFRTRARLNFSRNKLTLRRNDISLILEERIIRWHPQTKLR